MSSFGSKLAECRKAKNLSQKELAEIFSTSHTTIGKYERDESIPSLEIAEKMATVLNVSLDELVYGEQDEKARMRITDNELLNLFNKTQELTDDQKKTIMDLLSAFLLKSNLKQ